MVDRLHRLVLEHGLAPKGGMNWFLFALVLLLSLALGWMSWRYVSLRRSADNYARAIRRAAEGDLSPREPVLPAPALRRPQDGVPQVEP